MARHLSLMPDYGPYFGTVDGRAVTSVSQIPVSETTRAEIDRWWQIGYGDSDLGLDLDDDGYESLTRDLVSRLRAELGPEWDVTWDL